MAEKCTFCGETIELGTGTILVKKDGSLQRFCSGKCDKNLKMGRSPLKTRWTKTYRKFKGKVTKAEELRDDQADAENKAKKAASAAKTPSMKEGTK